MKRARLEAIVEGSPALRMRVEGRELISDALAEMLVSELQAHADVGAPVSRPDHAEARAAP